MENEEIMQLQTFNEQPRIIKNDSINDLGSESEEKTLDQVKRNRQRIRQKLKVQLFGNIPQPQKLCQSESSSNDIYQQNSPNTTSSSAMEINSANKQQQQQQDIMNNSNGGKSQTKIFNLITNNQNGLDQKTIDLDRQQQIFHIQNDFHKYYTIGQILGEGCMGLVKQCFRKSDNAQFAVKMVRTRDDETVKNIKREFVNLKKLNHPNIVNVYELYIDDYQGIIYSIMELIEGKEMFEVLSKMGSYNEEKAKILFKQILESIVYMHNNQIVHRDLKPNNIMCTLDGSQVKITDFNISKFSDHYKNYENMELNESEDNKIKMFTYTGTISFSAPEIFIGGGYDQSVDIWSSGILLYTMLCGKEPFQSEYVEDLIKKIIAIDYNFSDNGWSEISDDAKNLIRRCLQKNPIDRITPEQALKHPWFNNDSKFACQQYLPSTQMCLEMNYNHLVKTKEEYQAELQEQKISHIQFLQSLNNIPLKQQQSTRYGARGKKRCFSMCLPRVVRPEDFLFSSKCYDKVTHINNRNSILQKCYKIESQANLNSTNNLNTLDSISEEIPFNLSQSKLSQRLIQQQQDQISQQSLIQEEVDQENDDEEDDQQNEIEPQYANMIDKNYSIVSPLEKNQNSMNSSKQSNRTANNSKNNKSQKLLFQDNNQNLLVKRQFRFQPSMRKQSDIINDHEYIQQKQQSQRFKQFPQFSNFHNNNNSSVYFSPQQSNSNIGINQQQISRLQNNNNIFQGRKQNKAQSVILGNYQRDEGNVFLREESKENKFSQKQQQKQLNLLQQCTEENTLNMNNNPQQPEQQFNQQLISSNILEQEDDEEIELQNTSSSVSQQYTGKVESKQFKKSNNSVFPDYLQQQYSYQNNNNTNIQSSDQIEFEECIQKKIKFN